GDRGSLVERIVELAVQYVQVPLTEPRETLLAEQAFRQEALLNPPLRELAHAHQRILSRGATHFFPVLVSGQPEQVT
ncbi:TetR family transcriptional regulator, partial [Pseudomonas aeruginosa]